MGEWMKTLHEVASLVFFALMTLMAFFKEWQLVPFNGLISAILLLRLILNELRDPAGDEDEDEDEDTLEGANNHA
jgi:hypothetical protein